MCFLVLFCIRSLKNPKKILIIIQRANGDVFLSQTLINSLFEHYQSPTIDLLINDDTLAIARLIQNINYIHTFSYKKKRDNRWRQEKEIITALLNKYDLSINLTASDRGVLYALFAGKRAISAIEKDNKKSWWKQALLSHHYYFDTSKHILLNNLEPLKVLDIKHHNTLKAPEVSEASLANVKTKLAENGIKDFVIFHPSAQHNYKIYPKFLRDELLTQLSNLGVVVVITGSSNKIDTEIKSQLPKLPNVFDLMGETTLEQYLALSELSLAYVGMDTLNMHIAAAQNKRIFAIFGPTNLKMWSPWSNELKTATSKDSPMQTYGNITLFQADMPCVACGRAGCDDKHGKSECLDHIHPQVVFNEINKWYKNH